MDGFLRIQFHNLRSSPRCLLRVVRMLIWGFYPILVFDLSRRDAGFLQPRDVLKIFKLRLSLVSGIVHPRSRVFMIRSSLCFDGHLIWKSRVSFISGVMSWVLQSFEVLLDVVPLCLGYVGWASLPIVTIWLGVRFLTRSRCLVELAMQAMSSEAIVCPRRKWWSVRTDRWVDLDSYWGMFIA